MLSLFIPIMRNHIYSFKDSAPWQRTSQQNSAVCLHIAQHVLGGKWRWFRPHSGRSYNHCCWRSPSSSSSNKSAPPSIVAAFCLKNKFLWQLNAEQYYSIFAPWLKQNKFCALSNSNFSPSSKRYFTIWLQTNKVNLIIR